MRKLLSKHPPIGFKGAKILKVTGTRESGCVKIVMDERLLLVVRKTRKR